MKEIEINDVEVSNLNEYIKAVTEIRMLYLYGIDRRDEDMSKEEYAETLKESFPKKLYFRGQANKEWGIVPNVFRDNGLSCEAAMTHKAYLCSPEILSQHRTPFERLTILQHYELGTRLLDITANPLVALFFACQPCEENEEINTSSDFITELSELDFDEEQIAVLIEKLSTNKITTPKKKDGVVYFKCAFAENFNKMEIQLISHLAELDMTKHYSAKDLIEAALHKKIITAKEAEQLSSKKYSELIKVLQDAYFVESNFSNQRLIKQDGSFLIAGNVNVRVKPDDVGETVLIEKASGNLNSYFEQERIVIPEQFKATILKELDAYNINERSLFPEIDHQLHYIQMKCRENSRTVAAFSKHQNADTITTTPISADATDKVIDGNAGIIETEISKEYFDLIKNLLTVDWDKRDSIRADIYRRLKRYLAKQNLLNQEEIEQECNAFYEALCQKYAGQTFHTPRESLLSSF